MINSDFRKMGTTLTGGLARLTSLTMKKPVAVKIKVPDYKWCEEEITFENSVRYKALWVDSLFILAIIWTFGSIMTDEAKPEFDKWLKKQFEDRELNRERAAQ